MASLQQEPTGIFHIVVRIDGKRYKRSLATKVESRAVSRRDDIKETMSLIKRGKIQVPENVPVIEYVLWGGDCASAPEKDIAVSKPEPSNLAKIFITFFEGIPEGNIEQGTLRMLHIHERHLLRILKPRFDITKLTGQDLQKYINKRSKEKTHFFLSKRSSKDAKKSAKRTLVSATTIRKEIATLGCLWKWAATLPIVSGPFPNHGLRYPKSDEKPPFQTWAEIDRQIAIGQLNLSESAALWECLYLRHSEIEELLRYVEKNAYWDFIHPMFAMAAYTGARRSEILRSQRSDFDFEHDVVTIRERKRVKGKRSIRRVPLTSNLKQFMTDWFRKHPGGIATFVHQGNRRKPQPLSSSQAQTHFRQTLKGSRWDRVKGWHCLRHSFISNLACGGIDQRIIDDFVGHTTDEMRRRYRHLFPDVKHAAINQIFG